MVWKSKGDGEKRKYDFYYDAANRILRADFGQYTSGTFNQSAGVNYNMKMGDGSNVDLAYDANGNIKQMQQWGLKLNASPQIDNLAYTYQASSNKLSKVYDAITTENKLGDFYDGTNGTNTDYNYDANGNLILDNNKAISSITYNHLNLPSVITVTGKGTITYTYDAAGGKIKKVVAETGQPTKTTLYSGGAVFENDVLQFIAHEEGRMRPGTTGFNYDYFIKDHLGNVRMVLTEETKTDAYPAATLEPATINTEDDYYGNLTNTQYAKPSWFSDPLYTSSTKVAQVKNAAGIQKIGPNMVLKVMAGDMYNIRVASGWSGGSATNSSTNVLTDLLNLLSGSVAGVSGGKATQAELQNTSSGLNAGLTSFLGTQTTSGTKPKAYINWILLDEQFKVVSSNSGFAQVGSSGSATIHNLPNLTVNKSGYLYIYTSNEATNIDVFFDNLQVTHIRGPLIEENSYYPFGLTMSGISSNAFMFGSPLNKEKTFQGQRFDDDLGLDWIQFKWRNHDPQIGRFIEIDPLSEEYVYNSTYAFSENKVTNHIELEGLEATPAGYLQEGLAQITQGLAYAWDWATGWFAGNKTEESTPKGSSGTSIVTSHEKTTYVGGDMQNWVRAGRYSSSNTMPNVLPYIFTIKTETNAQIEIVNTQKAGNLEIENRVASDGSSATTKTTVKNVKLGNSTPLDISGSVKKDKSGTTTKFEVKTGSNNLKVGAVVEVKKNTNGDQKGKAGVLLEVKKETKNGSTIKNTTTVGKTF